MTASTLYEAIEPQVVWKQLLNSIMSEITGETSRTEAIHMTKFLLETFQVQDEEVQTIHLPIVFSAISESIRVRIQVPATPRLTVCTQAYLEKDSFNAASGPVCEALILQEEILRHIPATALKLRPRSQEKSQTPPSQGPLEFACSFYGIEKPPLNPIQRACVDRPFVTNFEDLAALTTIAATSLMSCTPELAHSLRGAFTQSVLLIMRLLGRMDQKLNVPFDIDWNPSEWLAAVLESVEHPVRRALCEVRCVGLIPGLQGSTFTMVDRMISLAVSLHHSQSIQPKLAIDSRVTISKMMTTVGPSFLKLRKVG